MKPAREPASSRPKPCASLKKTHESCRSPLHVALVGRKMTVVRDQLFPQKPPGSRFRFSRTGVQPSPGSSTIELPSAFAESGAFGPGCHQLRTSTAIYAFPCRHLTEGFCCGSSWCNKASRVSPRQTYWLPPKLFTENDKISTSPGRNFAVSCSCGPY